MDTAKQIYEKVKSLPDVQMKEVLNFVNFIASNQQQKEKPADESILKYAGVLKGSPNFNDDPVEIQKVLRDEWS